MYTTHHTTSDSMTMANDPRAISPDEVRADLGGKSLRQIRHDLRGRINAMRLCTSALEATDDPTELDEFLEDIERLSDRVVQLLDQLELAMGTRPTH